MTTSAATTGGPALPGAAAGANRLPERTGEGGGPGRASSTIRTIGLVLGPVLFVALLLLPIPGLPTASRGVLGMAAWMAVWWFSEAVPLAATSLLPLVVFPLPGRPELDGVGQNYADNSILLFLGTLLSARGISKVRIDERVALHLLRAFGGSPRRLVAGFMVACAMVSAWISSTATTVIMLPVAIAVVATIGDDGQRRRLGRCLVLAVTYASTLGVLSPIIATPPNVDFASLAPEVLGIEVGFGQWMLIGVPMSAVGVAICWVYLTSIAAPVGGISLAKGNKVVERRLRERGPVSRDEWVVVIVFVGTVVAWVTRSLVWGELLPTVSNTTIARRRAAGGSSIGRPRSACPGAS